MFQKHLAKFAQFFVSEVCPVFWRRFAFLIYWASNETDASISTIQNWRGRCVLQEGFPLVTNVSRERSQSTGAPILVSEPNDDSPSSTFNVSRAYIAKCPFAKSLSYPPYAAERIHWQNFIAQSIMFLIRDKETASWVPHEQKTSKKIHIEFCP